MTPTEILTYTTRAATRGAREEGTTVGRIKADTAERVLARIASGDIALSSSEILALSERMNHASGSPERSVAVSMLECIIGVGIRRAA